MSFWAGIKHALNSTLGTSEFKPLDKLITEQTRMVASDTFYAAIEGGGADLPNVGVEVTKELPKKIRMIRSGTVRFKGELYRKPYTRVQGIAIIYKNGVEVYRYSENSDDGSNTVPFSTDLAFVPGDVFSFKVAGTKTGSYELSCRVSIDNLTMNGTIEHKVFEIVS